MRTDTCDKTYLVWNREREKNYAQEALQKPDMNDTISVTSKKLPNVYKSCPKMISLEKLKILTPLQKLPKNVGDSGKLIVAKSFEKLPKVVQ